MKKTTLLSLGLLCLTSMGTHSFAQTSPTASKEIYDFTGFTDQKLLDLFAKALESGRKYPTMAEFEAAGIQASDIAFVRSHVKRADIMSRANRIVPTTYENRELWMNIPSGISKGVGGYPSSVFANDVYSMWNYTNIFGSWNHGVFQAPGAWVDAAHKNGTYIYSGIKFFESWGTGDGAYAAMIRKKNGDGTYKYVEPMINCLMFFGADGINYNWEDNSFGNDEVVGFHKALYKKAKEYGFKDFHIGIYTGNQYLTPSNVDALLGTAETGKTADVMLNYSGGDFSYGIENSAQTADRFNKSTEGLYAGVWIVSMDRGWTRLDRSQNAHKVNLCLWGEHAQSRLWSYNSGTDAYDAQDNYQSLLERAFSGGNRNPLSRPSVSSSGNNWEKSGTKAPLSTFCGLAQFIPERSAIQGKLPFATHFNLGNGDRYYYKGKKSAGSWYNMAAQDYVPTYRWLVCNANTMDVATNIQPSFTHNDAYLGGSCLELKGAANTTGTDIVLYKTKLAISAANPSVKVAIKSANEKVGPSHLYVILKKEGSDAWTQIPVPDVKGKTWQEDTLQVPLAEGDVIEKIGLRVKGNEDNYDLYVGKLELNDDIKVAPAEVKDVVVEVKEETTSSMSVKAHWNVDAQAKERQDWGLLYNDEANIDHFEILYKNGEKGRVSEVGRTSQWATYVGNILFKSQDDEPYFGVRSVSTDLKTYSPVVWVKVERAKSGVPELVEPDTYGESKIDPNAAGYDIAVKQRWLTDVTTEGAVENLDYHATGPQKDGTQYVNARNHVLRVRQGQTITIKLKAFDTSSLSKTDGLRWCFAGGWIDLNGSGNFDYPKSFKEDPMGEQIFFAGTIRKGTPEFETKGITATFKIPEDAKTGKSRLRIVFSDAWFAGTFLPSGLTAKGFTIDFDVQIEGDNAKQRGAIDKRDKGIPDEPVQLDVTNGVQSVKAGYSQAQVTDGTLQFGDVEKAWIYSADGKLVQYLNHNPQSVSLVHYAPGVYMVKMFYKNVIRTQKFVVK